MDQPAGERDHGGGRPRLEAPHDRLTNMRASGSDDTISIPPPRIMSLEQILGYLNGDELAEITPTSLRLRKKFLDENERKRQSKKQNVA